MRLLTLHRRINDESPMGEPVARPSNGTQPNDFSPRLQTGIPTARVRPATRINGNTPRHAARADKAERTSFPSRISLSARPMCSATRFVAGYSAFTQIDRPSLFATTRQSWLRFLWMLSPTGKLWFLNGFVVGRSRNRVVVFCDVCIVSF